MSTDVAAAGNTIWEEQHSSSAAADICTYWPANPAFELRSVLLRRLFYINEEKNKYVSVGFYPARDYQSLVEFGAIRRGGSKSLILADEQVDTLPGCLPAIHDFMCGGRDRVIINCESGKFSLHPPRRHELDTLFRYGVYEPDATVHGISVASVSRRAATIALLHNCFA